MLETSIKIMEYFDFGPHRSIIKPDSSMAIKGLFHVSHKPFNRLCFHSILNFNLLYWSIIKSSLHMFISELFLICQYGVHTFRPCISEADYILKCKTEMSAILFKIKYSLLLIEHI
jgi:hypothetical protein